ASAAPAPAPVARTEAGVVRGLEDGGVRAFKAVPYAAAPVGPLRWRPPAPAPRWTGVRTAQVDGPACPQALSADGRPNLGGYAGPVSEDCLTLDIWTPNHAKGAPVTVWIFGGGDVAGADSIAPNDGRFFARDGVVLVSINYRLGALGFFAHPALTRAARAREPLG